MLRLLRAIFTVHTDESSFSCFSETMTQVIREHFEWLEWQFILILSVQPFFNNTVLLCDFLWLSIINTYRLSFHFEFIVKWNVLLCWSFVITRCSFRLFSFVEYRHDVVSLELRSEHFSVLACVFFNHFHVNVTLSHLILTAHNWFEVV